MNIKPTQFVLEHKPWSVSKAKTAEQCPLKFKLTYIDKKKGSGSNSAALVGQAAHQILEILIQDDSTWLLAHQSAQDAHQLTSPELTQLENLKLPILNFVRRLKLFRERNGIVDAHVEKRLGVDLDGKPTEFFDNNGFLRGVVDLVLFPPAQPHAIIIDHKSGRPRNLSDYEIQFNSYTMLIKAAYPHIVGSKVGVNHIKDDSLDFLPVSDITDIEPYWDNMITYLNEATKQTHTFKTQTGWWCDWCDRQIYCPLFREDNGTTKNQGNNP